MGYSNELLHAEIEALSGLQMLQIKQMFVHKILHCLTHQSCMRQGAAGVSVGLQDYLGVVGLSVGLQGYL